MTSSSEPSLNLWPVADEGVRAAMEQMLADGSWGRYHGPHCDALRAALQDYHSVEHALLCCSGTAAVELALRAVNVAPGDEVILAAYDYKANFANVLSLGARPVLVDTLEHRPVLNPDQLTSALSSATKAIICSHLHGCLAPIDEIVRFAREYGLAVIEDACQVPGARLQNRRAGTIGDVGVLSFGGSKLLTSGRGGAVLTQDGRIAQRLRLYTQRGNDAYPLSEMQAAVLLPQLRLLDERNQQRLRSIHLLRKRLSEESGLQLICDEQIDAESAYYKVPFWCSTESVTSRNDLEQFCSKSLLDPGFPALHLIHARSRFRPVGELPEATQLHGRLLTLHHPILLAAEDRMERLAEALSD